jgi:hypothetical protein
MNQTSNTQQQSVPIAILGPIQEVYQEGECVPHIRIVISGHSLYNQQIDVSLIVADHKIIAGLLYGPNHKVLPSTDPVIAGALTINNVGLTIYPSSVLFGNLKLANGILTNMVPIFNFDSTSQGP